MATTLPGIGPSTASQPRDGGHLFGPIWDFLLLGGGSLLALLVIRATASSMADGVAWSLATTLALANAVNHPHFAHSYQIFYSNFRAKLRSDAYARELRTRYFLVGIVAPVAIAAFLATCILGGQAKVLGIAANAMFFLVGWHYIKQGFGMAMVDAVLKRRFYDAGERSALLWNGYAVWLFSWLLVNHLSSRPGRPTPEYFDIPYFAIPIPAAIVWLAGLAAVVTTLRCALALSRRYRRGTPVAWNGVLAYATTLYAWLLIRDPIVLLWVPLFHSIQYLAVVWRYKLNEAGSGGERRSGRVLRLGLFAVAAVCLGYYAFWRLPAWLDATVAYDKTVFGGALFFFAFWVFINVHHYLMDSVMWRKGNPDVARHLFHTVGSVTPQVRAATG